MRLNIDSAGIAGKDTVVLQLTRCIRVWPETAICLSHRSSSAIWLLNAVWLYATRWLYAMEAFEPRTYKKMVRWLLWLKTRHRTRLAVQQQRFATDSTAD